MCASCYHEGWHQPGAGFKASGGVYSTYSNYIKAGRKARPADKHKKEPPSIDGNRHQAAQQGKAGEGEEHAGRAEPSAAAIRALETDHRDPNDSKQRDAAVKGVMDSSADPGVQLVAEAPAVDAKLDQPGALAEFMAAPAADAAT